MTSLRFVALDSDDRIVYGSGKVIPSTEIEATARAILQDPHLDQPHRQLR